MKGGEIFVAARETGTVKWFNNAKGYGFISRDSGEDIFVHYSGINGDGYRSLRGGARVEFTVAQSDKGPQAQDVTILDKDKNKPSTTNKDSDLESDDNVTEV
jgi:CspA family cold shock protein